MLSLLILVITVQFLFPLPASGADDLIVSLRDGKVQGTTYTSPNNKTYYGFQGIPYGAPPVGDLRFQAPRPASPWRGIWDATKDSQSCVSILYNMIPFLESEDCLYISVYTPSRRPERKLPVMIWHYGGKFVIGSARKNEYGPDFILDEDVIMVTANYRLGPFGFLSTGDSAIVGNAGLKDQALAIKWVHDNIAYFGGDPDQITLFGESAGGASVGLQLVNKNIRDIHYMYGLADGNALQARRLYEDRFPNRNIPDARTFSNIHRRLCGKGSFELDNHLKGVQRTVRTPEIIEVAILNGVEEDLGFGLFRAAIVQSGSALTNWTIDPNPKAYVDLLTSQLGGDIYLNDTQQIKRFLQRKSPSEIMAAADRLRYKDGEVSAGPMDLIPHNIPWPVIEVDNHDAFLTESPYKLLDSGRFNQVPIMIGVCANEAGMFYQDLRSAQDAARGFDNDPISIIPDNLRQSSSDNDAIISTIKSLYLSEGETFSNNLVALSSYQGDHMFVKGTIKQAELTSRHVPVYLYQFSYFGRSTFPYSLPGVEKAAHGAELPFLFKQTAHDSIPEHVLISKRIAKLWTNFAKYVNPTPQKSELLDVIWPTITADNFQYLNINVTLEVRSSLRGARYKGWTNIYETYGKKPFITF